MRLRLRHVVAVALAVASISFWTGAADAAVIVGTGGVDSLFGTNARDTISGSGAFDHVFGKRGRDRLSESGDILPGAGRDVVVGGPDGVIVVDDDASADRLAGNEGDDLFFAADGGRDVISCGLGRDAVFADPNDSIATDCEGVIDGSVSVATATITFGTNRSDVLTAGGVGTNLLAGRRGNDTLTGGASADQLHPGPGKDVVNGGGGGDALIDDDGTPGDQLNGGDGSDTFLAADGAVDTIDCGLADAATDNVFADPGDTLVNCGADTVVTG